MGRVSHILNNFLCQSQLRTVEGNVTCWNRFCLLIPVLETMTWNRLFCHIFSPNSFEHLFIWFMRRHIYFFYVAWQLQVLCFCVCLQIRWTTLPLLQFLIYSKYFLKISVLVYAIVDFRSLCILHIFFCL